MFLVAVEVVVAADAPYSGTPQGGIVSPILANIYLDKFDKYIREYINRFNKGEIRKENR